MQARATLRDHLLFAAALALLLALSLPGIAAHAEDGIAPSSRELTGLGAAPAPGAPIAAAPGDSCAAADPNLVAKQYDAQREAMQRLAQAMQAEGDGEVRVLDGRGYGYFADRNPGI
ncbi:MAG: hypothetical protein ACHQ6V_10210, partial [Myxococcota bacterium]